MYKHFFKRVFDIFVGLIALPFVLLLIVIFAPIIFFTDKGPVFYCGKRVGKNGKPFRMIKFRSMKVNAPDIRLDDGSTYNGEDDPRVTAIGKFLRKTSIDEMPQFLNVLFGQMSLIGPRPDPLDWLDKYPEDIKVFLTVRPGITGYSQAYYRNSADGYQKMQHDAYYARNISFGLDIKIFFKTIATVIKRDNTFKDNSPVIKEYGYEYQAKTNEKLINKTKGKTTNKKYIGAYCLRSGRDALALIALNSKKGIVLMPALACESMISPFEKHSHKVVFYDINQDGSIDKKSIYRLLDNNSGEPVLLLYMDYFGIESFSSEEIVEIKNKYANVTVINDITHTFLYVKIKRTPADFTIASVRKWANLADGGLLWTKKKISLNSLSNDTSFSETRIKAQNLRYLYGQTGDEKLKDEYRKIFSSVSSIVDESKKPAKMSLYSYCILKSFDFSEIKEIRSENASVLIQELSSSSNISFLNKKTDACNLYVPILIKERDAVQKKLSEQGIFCTIIWPLRETQRVSCKNAAYIEKTILAIPCDQRYSEEDMKLIGKAIVRCADE